MGRRLATAGAPVRCTKALNVIRGDNARLNDSLPRLAFKMATGSGKTVVMGMFIAWQALNKLANPFDKRFSTRFLLVTPGITIRDRLRVLLPNDPQTFYRTMDLVTPEQLVRLQATTIEITNYHAFIRRDKIEAAPLTKKILSRGDADNERFKETPGEMVRRVCKAFGTARDIVVLNDEAHHCYTPTPAEAAEEGSLDPDERTEAKRNADEARVWFDGLRALRDKLGIRSIFDVSPTPFFLKGSGYTEGTLFPWVVSDFGLMDAIESGIVKILRVPVSDDSMVGDLPKYRDLWVHVRDALPRKGLRDTTVGEGDPILPKELEGALESLYGDYQRSHREWDGAGMGRSPVLIVVCSNTSVSKLVYDWIAGYDKPQTDGSTIPAPGKLPLLSNIEDGAWRHRPVTLLIASMQLDRGERPRLLPQLTAITRRWIDECVTPYLGDGAYPQLLLLAEWSYAAAEKIHRAIVMGTPGEKRLVPILRPYEPVGSTDDVNFETTKVCFDTTKSHVNRVAQDSNWETELAQKLETMPQVVSYARNQALVLKIPYTYEGRPANYVPDFLIRLRDRDSRGDDDLLTVVLEVSGETKKEKQAKVAAAADLWVPAVNNWGGLGRWAFLEVSHMENAADLIRSRFLEPGGARR